VAPFFNIPATAFNIPATAISALSARPSSFTRANNSAHRTREFEADGLNKHLSFGF
jgi:hypothetical protein